MQTLLIVWVVVSVLIAFTCYEEGKTDILKYAAWVLMWPVLTVTAIFLVIIINLLPESWF